MSGINAKGMDKCNFSFDNNLNIHEDLNSASSPNSKFEKDGSLAGLNVKNL